LKPLFAAKNACGRWSTRFCCYCLCFFERLPQQSTLTVTKKQFIKWKAKNNHNSFDETNRIKPVWGRTRKLIFIVGWSRFYVFVFVSLGTSCLLFGFLWSCFQQIGQNGRAGRREPPRSTSSDETNRMKSVWGRTWFAFWKLCDFILYICFHGT